MSLPTSFLSLLQVKLDCNINEWQSISGGDINHAILLHTNRGDFFVKFNHLPHASEMLTTEQKGLTKLHSSNSIKIPALQSLGSDDSSGIHFLVLDFVKNTSNRTVQFWEKFGFELAELHQNTDSLFGLPYDNYIGSLKQSNYQKKDWFTFFIEERLNPQLKLGLDQQKIDSQVINTFEQLFLKLTTILPKEPPALLHGDLWSGNFLCSTKQEPYLIDPAIYYGHREMDLAMTQLFGGFSPIFYQSYHNAFPLSPRFQNRVEIYQLYPLLVHVNLFGGSYLNQVKRILNKFI